MDPDTAPAAELHAWHEFCVATDRFDLPGEPDPPRADTLGPLIGDEDRRSTWFTRSAGDIVGGVTLVLAAFENAHSAEVGIRVRPDARRAGIGRVLFGHARSVALAEGRTEFETWVLAGGPGVAFAQAMGMRPALEEVRRILQMSGVDASVHGLAAGAAARTDGFDLVRWVDRCPDEWLEAYSAARNGMNDAPTGELDWRPESLTGPRMRVREGTSVRRGWRRYVVAVRDRSTGTIAGLTEMFVSPDSVRAHQGSTTVLERYRGRGFGLWVKAAMIRWLSEVEPHVTEHETGNAAENQHMIAINERLGYRAVGSWQVLRQPLP
ncbi:MAG TPA: GNAT family N-acetyltransferase [Mycobacteriales bacterium]|nr:GNAT family N-acetyltransferase [Mycobacteriales bacterium]